MGMDVEELIEQARVEGWKELNLSDRELTELPDALWELTEIESLDLSGNELTELPGAIGQLVGLRSLMLGQFYLLRKHGINQLTQLPPEIGQLTNLTKLDLRYNQLSQLPAEFDQLSNLTELDLKNNQLRQLPDEFARLTYLTYLDLSNNQLTRLPAEFGTISNLTELYLSNNKLTRLPAEVGTLSNLTELDLSNNQLTQLPAEVGTLSNLTELDLSNNQLTQLPAEVGTLSNLTELYLSNNQLTQLPAEVGTLSNLTELDLSNNQLTQLPARFNALTNLTKLDLSNNQLTRLPAEVGTLSNLTELDLNNNQLTQLPARFNALTNLTKLDLSNNQLTRLPTGLSVLKKMQKLDLRENNLPIPPEILGKSQFELGKPADILNYYFQLQTEQTQPLNEAKLLIVGQGSVGKTSLVNRLLHNRFNQHENKTEGISIQSWQVRDIQLNVWDFGGQEIMHATHQFFLTKRSLYLLVLDSRSNEEGNQLEYWLKIIQSFGGKSPVIVIGNKIDQHQLELDRRGLQLKYPNIKAFIETSCQTGEGIESLEAVIAKEVNQLNHIKDELPLSWFELKNQLEQMKRDYIPYPEYIKLCQDKDINEQSQQTLIGFLHDLGVVLNFRDDPRLEDTNILNPAWVTNGVYQILNDNALMTKHKGILERSMLSKILDSDKYPKSKQLFIIDMMRKFELCFDLIPDKQFLIPDLLSKEEPDTGQWDNTLAFQYHYNVLPGSIISRFIVRSHAMLSKKTYWRSGAVLAHEWSRALVKADREDKKIFISVSGEQTTRRQLLSIIRSHFKHIHGTITGIEVEEMVPVPRSPIPVRYKHLLTLERNDVQTFIPDGLEKPVNVKELLNGVEPEYKRMGQARDPIREDFDHLARMQERFLNMTYITMPEPPKTETHYHGSVGVVGNQGSIGNVADIVKGNMIGTQNNTSSEQLSKAEAIELLTQFTNLIQNNQTLNEADKKKVDRYIGAAKTEIEEEEEPDKQLIAKHLERTAKTLEEASKNVEVGKNLWSQAQPSLMEIFKGLGIATHFLTGGVSRTLKL